MRIASIILTTFLFSLYFSSVSLASPEESFYKGNVLGSSGWDFGYDSEEEELELNTRDEDEELNAEKKESNDDFFNKDVRVYDRGISRTAKEEQALKGRGVLKSGY